MDTIQSNTVFTNVAETSDGGVFWEGLEKEINNDITIESWLGDTLDKTAVCPNSRFVICIVYAICAISTINHFLLMVKL